jgi:hypothetical protein
MPSGKQTRQVDVERGLLLVRYTTADDENRPPIVKIAVNPKDQKNIELLLSPDDQEAVLWKPGCCLVVRASKPGRLVVEVIAVDAGGSTAATVKLETLTQRDVPPAIRPEAGALIKSDRLSILGHVAGFGDVVVHENEWIAGPDAPARIEGLAIGWPGKPDNMELRYAVKLARPHIASGRITQLGDYAGTRGRALPIVGLTLELTGPAASSFQLSGEATFLGAPLMRVRGKRIAIAGPTGREPLVGFRLRLDEPSPPLQPQLPKATRTKASRVRVFRPPSAKSRRTSAVEALSDRHDERQPA